MQAVQLETITSSSSTVQVKRERESIHSGQFMVSHFEAEEQDDEDEVAVPIPEETENTNILPVKELLDANIGGGGGGGSNCNNQRNINSQQQLSIDTSLAKLFQCMSLAYRQKLTSPKWNRFRGIRLRWKDKIRLNNVIWRCWHMQFIKKKNTLICQFASPLDVDTHNKPEAIVLEGKYWKRKLAAVTAEYKKWRMFYRNHSLGHSLKDDVEMLSDTDFLNSWNSQSNENVHMMVDEDYMGLMSDTLFSTITNQPFVFPDSREIARAGLADFIQPSLGPLQPNLDDYMDTFEPLQEFVAGKLATVPEEQTQSTWNYSDLDLIGNNASLQLNTIQTPQPPTPPPPPPPPLPPPPSSSSCIEYQQPTIIQTDRSHLYTTSPITQQEYGHNQQSSTPPPYHSVVATKSQTKSKRINQTPSHLYTTNYTNQQQPNNNNNNNNSLCVNEQLLQQQQQQQQQQLAFQQIPMVPPQQILTQQPPPPSLPPPPPPSSSSSSTTTVDLQQFKVNVDPLRTTSGGYKFTNTTIQNMKFTSQVPPPPPPYMSQPIHSVYPQYDSMHSLLKDDKAEVAVSAAVTVAAPRERVGGAKTKPRSRSNTREVVQKRPPLISAVSDPALLSSHKNSLLLTQLLTNNGDNSLYNCNHQTLITTTTTTHSHEQLSNQIQIKEENNSSSSSSSSMPILPQRSTAATLIITTPCINTAQSSVNNNNNDPLSFSSSNSPILDTSQNINSPTSSQGSLGSPGRSNNNNNNDNTINRDQRRVGHIHAEQKRRYNIKNGFDMIHSLIPHLNQNPNAKLSKATMLQKGAEYIRQLRSERNQLNEEMECLRQQIETLNTSISNCQSMLPATGAPVSRKRDSKMKEMFDDYVRKRTMEDWKYYIFSLLFRPLLESFNTFVSTSSLEDLYRSTMLWIEQHCTLGDLRRVVLNSLKYLSTKTEILTEPERLPEEARQLVAMNTSTINQNN